MLRLVFVTGTLSHGGAERHAITVMNRLTDRGHECHAVYVKNDHPDQLDRLRLRNGGAVRCLNAARYLDLNAVTGFGRHLARLKPAGIVAANPYALMYSVLAARSSGLQMPVVFTFHSTRILGIKEQMKMLLDRLFICTADRIVFVCENQRRYWLNHGMSPRRTQVIYNGVDTDQFCGKWNSEARANLRRALKFSAQDYVVGISAVLRSEKNHVQLVDAIARLRSAGIPARALMIGDGPMRPVIEARARACGLSLQRDVVITGFQEQVCPYIAACDAMALCSLTETFSMAALEAMALGKPVVLSDVGGASEMICSGENGLLFPVGDTKALADKLAILADRVVSTRIGTNARKAVEERFSERSMVDRYEQLVVELCGVPLGSGTPALSVDATGSRRREGAGHSKQRKEFEQHDIRSSARIP